MRPRAGCPVHGPEAGLHAHISMAHGTRNPKYQPGRLRSGRVFAYSHHIRTGSCRFTLANMRKSRLSIVVSNVVLQYLVLLYFRAKYAVHLLCPLLKSNTIAGTRAHPDCSKDDIRALLLIRAVRGCQVSHRYETSCTPLSRPPARSAVGSHWPPACAP